MQLGMIGLGRMGANIVRLVAKGGHECVVYDHSGTDFVAVPEFEISKFRLPPGDGRIYCVYADVSDSTFADTITFNTNDVWGWANQRWLSLRGADN